MRIALEPTVDVAPGRKMLETGNGDASFEQVVESYHNRQRFYRREGGEISKVIYNCGFGLKLEGESPAKVPFPFEGIVSKRFRFTIDFGYLGYVIDGGKSPADLHDFTEFGTEKFTNLADHSIAYMTHIDGAGLEVLHEDEWLDAGDTQKRMNFFPGTTWLLAEERSVPAPDNAPSEASDS